MDTNPRLSRTYHPSAVIRTNLDYPAYDRFKVFLRRPDRISRFENVSIASVHRLRSVIDRRHFDYWPWK